MDQAGIQGSPQHADEGPHECGQDTVGRLGGPARRRLLPQRIVGDTRRYPVPGCDDAVVVLQMLGESAIARDIPETRPEEAQLGREGIARPGIGRGGAREDQVLLPVKGIALGVRMRYYRSMEYAPSPAPGRAAESRKPKAGQACRIRPPSFTGPWWSGQRRLGTKRPSIALRCTQSTLPASTAVTVPLSSEKSALKMLEARWKSMAFFPSKLKKLILPLFCCSKPSSWRWQKEKRIDFKKFDPLRAFP